MKTKIISTHIMEKPKPKIISALSKIVKRIMSHKTLENTIRHSEEDTGID